ncbi:tyrosine-type recombinase/integrase [Paenibacillus xylanexedens]|uniref:tyrosine-type recombinase/integrase n=1 Tax=Paenibacillus xylanexedens TaxID=528191 RepID=UPI0021B16E5E|nr:tyrosine-type recombinase/integrase [Paenibacillus xylanexedens]
MVAFSRILQRCDLPSLPIHSLRQTCAVLLLESGADMKFVQEQLGHGSIQITSDVYAHISGKIQKSNIDRFEKFTEEIFEWKNILWAFCGHFGFLLNM